MNHLLPRIEYRSMPADVSMGDDWYNIASLDHFWIKHRFKIFERMHRDLSWAQPRPAPRAADIGCGSGLLQRQLGDKYGWRVDGYDLNQAALSTSIAINQYVAFYDINERHEDLRNVYDMIFLFDVIEHLEDESAFLESIKFHLKPSGLLVINVPAGQWLYSRYDKVAGHFRRYSRRSLNRTLRKAGLSTLTCSYWGLPYVPLIAARKIVNILRKRLTDSQVIESGFEPQAGILNGLFSCLARIDPFPNFFAGSSLMGIYRIEQPYA